MANLTKCPHCGADIEDDSIFCDQCGAQLNKCSKCGKFIKGKFCPACGAPALSRDAAGAGTPQPAANPVNPVNKPAAAGPAVQPQQPPQQPQTPPQQQPQQQYQQPAYQQPYQQQGYQVPRPTTNPPAGGTSVAGGGGPAPSRLSCRALGIILPLQPGAVIGRTNGNYIAQLSALNFISGTHARLDFNGVSWTLTDLNSTNGTMVNNVPCAPALPIKIGDVVRIARTYDFYVE